LGGDFILQGGLWENFFQERLVKTPAAIFVGTTFNRQVGRLIFGVSSLYCLAGRACIAVNNHVDGIYPWIFSKLLQRDRSLGKLFQIRATAGACCDCIVYLGVAAGTGLHNNSPGVCFYNFDFTTLPNMAQSISPGNSVNLDPEL
jgi:hypothetical protein